MSWDESADAGPLLRLSHKSLVQRSQLSGVDAQGGCSATRAALDGTPTGGTYGSTIQEPNGRMILLGLIWVSLVLLSVVGILAMLRAVASPRLALCGVSCRPGCAFVPWQRGLVHTTSPPRYWTRLADLVHLHFSFSPDRTGLSHLCTGWPVAWRTGLAGPLSVVHDQLWGTRLSYVHAPPAAVLADISSLASRAGLCSCRAAAPRLIPPLAATLWKGVSPWMPCTTSSSAWWASGLVSLPPGPRTMSVAITPSVMPARFSIRPRSMPPTTSATPS